MKFGDLLREHRDRSRDPGTGKPLTQGRVADLIQEKTGVIYTGAAVSEWERNKSQINKDDRAVLTALIAIFHQCGGLTSSAEANRLLAAGNYRSLDPGEVAAINRDWSAEAPDDGPPERPERPSPPRVVFGVLVEWFRDPDRLGRRFVSPSGNGPPPDATDVAVLMFGRFWQHWTPWRVATAAVWGLLAIAVWHTALPLLYWPLADPWQTAVWYVGSVVLVPAAVAGWEEIGARRRSADGGGAVAGEGARAFFAYTGALIGFQFAYTALLLPTVFAYDVWNRTLGDAGRVVQLAAAGWVLFVSLIGARQAPRTMQRAFGRWHVAEGDVAVLAAMLLLGVGVAWLVTHFHAYLLQHTFLGTAVVLVALAATGGLIAREERRSGRSVIPAPFWAGLAGAVWALSALQRFDWLEAATAAALTAVIVVSMQKGRFRLTLGGLLLLLVVCAALGVVLTWYVTLGRVLTAVGAAAWIGFGRRLVWFSPAFWIMIAAAVAADYLAARSAVAVWPFALGLVGLAAAIVVWEALRP